jgi:hypothetical protein
MLSCIGPPVNRRSIAEFGVIGSAAITAVVHDLSVVCKLNQLPLGSAQTVTVTTHQSDNPQYAYMEHEYMNPDLSMPSWTRLRWQLNASSLLLETEHTYPQEGISIQSETTVTVIDTFRQESAHGR